MTKATQEQFKPVAFTPKQTAAQKRAADPAFQKAYDALEDEFAALAELAQRMGVSQPVLARIESSLGSRNHAPSLSTLRRYAQACGKRLVISMV
jgi:transcriptional regulator with XRE-family HTH domain